MLHGVSELFVIHFTMPSVYRTLWCLCLLNGEPEWILKKTFICWLKVLARDLLGGVTENSMVIISDVPAKF